MKPTRAALDTRTAIEQAVRHGGFPRRQCEAMAKGWKPTSGQEYAAAAIAERVMKGQTTLILGPAGTGKTQLACGFGVKWAGREWRPREGKAVYFTLASLLAKQKSWFARTRVAGEVSPFEHASDAGLLFVDEITVQNASEYDQREIRELIDERYRNLKPTVLISNLEVNSLGDVFDEPTIDRLTEGRNGLVEMTGESIRDRIGEDA